MAYSNNMRLEAVALRRKGYSLKEISVRFNIAKSTASLWCENVALSTTAEARLSKVIKKGQLAGIRSKRAKVQEAEARYFSDALNEICLSPNHDKILCAMIYWCEGAKSTRGGVAFTNSDPDLIRTFLRLFRKCFKLNEDRFHACIHLHSYHSPQKQLDFWSKVTDIKREQFVKPYRKANSGKRIHPNYQGCINIRYHNSDIARRLMAVAKAFLKHMGV